MHHISWQQLQQNCRFGSMSLSYVILLILSSLTLQLITATKCKPVNVASDSIVMTDSSKLVRHDIKHDLSDKLQDIYTGISSSKHLLQIDKCGNIHFLSLKKDVFQFLYSEEMRNIKEGHSNIPSHIKEYSNTKNNVLNSIGLLYYSGHGFINALKSFTCTATLVTPTHILTSAHCVISKIDKNDKHLFHTLDLSKFRFFPAANKQYIHWMDHILSKIKLGHIGSWFTLKKFIKNEDTKSVGIKNIFIPYSYIDRYPHHDWTLVELNKPLIHLQHNAHKRINYALMSFGFDDNLEARLDELKKKGELMKLHTAGYPSNERCCKLYPKPFDVSVIDDNVLFDNVHQHYQGQSGSPIWRKHDISNVMYGILMGGEIVGTDAWRIEKDEFYIICDLIRYQYPHFCK